MPKLSPYQQACLNWVTKDTGSLIVHAVAGSGKTFVLLNIAERLPPNKKSIFLSFNKKMAEELQDRLPSHIESRTLNSLGNMILRTWNPHLKFDQHKTSYILESEFDRNDYLGAGYQLIQMIEKAKNHLYVPGTDFVGFSLTKAKWLWLIEHYEIEVNPDLKFSVPLMKMANKLLRLGLTTYKNIVDHNDNLYMSVALKLNAPKYDWVFVDEAQDVSPVQRALLRRILRRDVGRFVGVGDKNQAIYSFRGADTHSLEKLAKSFQCKQLPLSISYRCPTEVVKLAKSIVPELEPSPYADAGNVRQVKTLLISELLPGDFLICRNNGPLIDAALKLLVNNKPCYIVGRDIPKVLVDLVYHCNGNTMQQLAINLDSWYERSVKRSLDFDQMATLAGIKDRYNSLKTLISAYPKHTISELVIEIEGLFCKNDGVILSTAHQAKGLEAERVFILQPDLFQEDEQGRNLRYVAYTRTQNTLTLVESLV